MCVTMPNLVVFRLVGSKVIVPKIQGMPRCRYKYSYSLVTVPDKISCAAVAQL